MTLISDRPAVPRPRPLEALVDLSEPLDGASAAGRRAIRTQSRMTEAELIAAYGGLPIDDAPAVSVREQHQRAVAAAIEEAEARLVERGMR